MSVRKVGDKDVKTIDDLLPSKSLEDKLRSNLENVTPEEKQISGYENNAYEELEKAARLRSSLQDIAERKRYAFYIFCMVCVWLFSIITIIILVGANVLKISDAVQIALITSTTLNVITFFVIVTKYLFPSSNNNS